MSLYGNTGGVVFPAGTVFGPLRWDADVPAPQQGGTTVEGPRSGQCR
ncbi:hypothetical protein [Streptomyces sp. A1547]|nr:hypothetical protein [Streptomyces sp. A1547]